jgi:hypothetical protein
MIRATLTDRTPLRLIHLERTDAVLTTRDLVLGDTEVMERPVKHVEMWTFVVSPVSEHPQTPWSADARLRIVAEAGNGLAKEGDLIRFEEIYVSLIPVGGDVFRADFLGRGLEVVERRPTEGGN